MFRTCDITGFKVDLKAQTLIRVNAVFAVVSLLVAIACAILLVFTRWPQFHLLDAEWFYRVLTAHGLNALIFWIVFFEAAGLVFGSTVTLNARMAYPMGGWIATYLMIGGFLLTNIMVFQGFADVLFTSYVPLKAHPLYYLGIILFAVGALLMVAVFFGNLMVARKEKTYGESLPLFTYGLTAAAIIAVITLATGAIIYIPALLWSMGIIENLDPATYKVVWWGLGHSSQQINVCAMVAIWYLMSLLTVGGVSINEKVSRTGFALYVLFICIASAHHLLTDPVVSSPWKVWNTSYAMYAAVLASMIHAFAVPSSIEVAQRRKGLVNGMFQWLAKAPWGNPAFSSLVISVAGFGFIGGITGVIYGKEQINIIVHNTIAITGHFKGTVVIGTTLAFMGISYYLVPLIFRRKIVAFGLAKWQPWIFGIGIALVAVGMLSLGGYGVPRRHWDNSFSGGPFGHTFNPSIDLFWGIVGIGGVLAFLGALIWVLQMTITVFFGPKIKGPQDFQLALAAVPEAKKEHKGFEAPGTLTLTLFFMILLVVFFLLNMKWLAGAWEVQ
ncbi:MAG: cbb3-type cytochrome c oxidase subunit I [Bacteroidota bacterium]